jgi:hypothetical protein
MKESKPIIPMIISILVVIGWLVFFVYYTFIWSTPFTFFQNLVITFISLLIAGGIAGLSWVTWGFWVGEEWFKSIAKEAGINPNDVDDEKISEIIHQFIGECAKEGRCSFDWNKAGTEIKANPQLKKELKQKFQECC